MQSPPRTAAAVSKSSELNRSRSLLAESPEVFRGGLGCHLCLALDHDADLLDDLRVGKRSDVANFHGVGDGGQYPAHDFARARLGHVGDDANALGSRDFANRSLDYQ